MTTRIARQSTTQFTARLPEELHTWLAERARNNHRSANAELAAILDALRTQETPERKVQRRGADWVCPECCLPSAYGMTSPEGLCRRCEFVRLNS